MSTNLVDRLLKALDWAGRHQSVHISVRQHDVKLTLRFNQEKPVSGLRILLELIAAIESMQGNTRCIPLEVEPSTKPVPFDVPEEDSND